MAKPNQKRRDESREPGDEGTIIEAIETTSDPGLGLETSPNPAGSSTPPTVSPSIVDQLPEKRIQYEGKKPGEIVLSLSKEDLDQRSLKQILAVCPVHNTACVSTSTANIYTHVGCPVKGCKFTLKVVRPTVAQKLHKLPQPQRDISRGRIPG